MQPLLLFDAKRGAWRFSLAYAKEAFAKIGCLWRKHLISDCCYDKYCSARRTGSDCCQSWNRSRVKCGLFRLYTVRNSSLGSVIKDFLSPDFVLIGEWMTVRRRARSILPAGLHQQSSSCAHVDSQCRTDQNVGEFLHDNENLVRELLLACVIGYRRRRRQCDLGACHVWGRHQVFERRSKATEAMFAERQWPRHISPTASVMKQVSLWVLTVQPQSWWPCGGKAMSCLSGWEGHCLWLAYKPGTWVVEESLGVDSEELGRSWIWGDSPWSACSRKRSKCSARRGDLWSRVTVRGANLVIVTTLDDAYAGLPAMAKVMSQNASVLDVWDICTDRHDWKWCDLGVAGAWREKQSNIDAVSVGVVIGWPVHACWSRWHRFSWQYREKFSERGAVVIAPRSADYDLVDREQVKSLFADTNPSIVVHAAGFLAE